MSHPPLPLLAAARSYLFSSSTNLYFILAAFLLGVFITCSLAQLFKRNKPVRYKLHSCTTCTKKYKVKKKKNYILCGVLELVKYS